MNFVNGSEKRHALAAACGVVAYKVLYLFDNGFYWKPEELMDDDRVEWRKRNSFVSGSLHYFISAHI